MLNQCLALYGSICKVKLKIGTVSMEANLIDLSTIIINFKIIIPINLDLGIGIDMS